MGGRTLLLVLLCSASVTAQDCAGTQGYHALKAMGCTIVTGDLNIRDSSITAVDLTGFVSIEGQLNIQGCRILTSITASSSLTSVQHIKIEDNGDLVEISGFTSISTLEMFRLKNNDKLVTMDAFSALTHVTGLLIEYNDVLSTLNSFPSLREVGGAFSLKTNRGLVSFAFPTLSAIGGNVNVENNDAMMTLEGLSALTQVDGNIVLKYNSALESTGDAFQRLAKVDELRVQANHAMTHLSFPAVRTVASLTIENNNALEETGHFFQLESVSGNFRIENNDKLTKLGSFDTLATVGGELRVEYNDQLSTLNTSFPSVRQVESLTIKTNRGLQSLAFPALAQIEGHLSIENNDALTSLDGFYALTAVNSITLKFNNALVTTGDSFKQVTEVTDVHVQDNSAMKTFSFPALLTARSFAIENNGELEESGRFNNLEKISGTLRFDNNDKLTKIGSFDSLTAIEGGLLIEFNDELPTLANSFPALQQVTDLTFTTNRMLANIALPALLRITRALKVENNDQLTALDGLAVLEDVGDTIAIRYNSILESVGNAFKRVPTLDTLHVQDNNALKRLFFPALRTVASLTIENNNALEEIRHFFQLESVSGIFRIDNNDKLTSLGDFRSLTNVGSLLVEYNDALPTIGGSFEALTKVGDLTLATNRGMSSFSFPVLSKISGSLLIADMDQLVSLDGLGALKQVDTLTLRFNSELESTGTAFRLLTKMNVLHVTNNAVLKTLVFPALLMVDGLSIENNPALEETGSFTALESVTGTFRIDNNDKLTKVSGFDALTTIGGGLLVEYNDALVNMDSSFPALKEVQDLTFTGNKRLASFEFPSLSLLTRSLKIDNNDRLATLDGLSALTEVGSVTLKFNSLLGHATLPAVTQVGSLSIESNSILTNLAFPKLSAIHSGVLISNNDRLDTLAGFCSSVAGQPQSPQELQQQSAQAASMLPTIMAGLALAISAIVAACWLCKVAVRDPRCPEPILKVMPRSFVHLSEPNQPHKDLEASATSTQEMSGTARGGADNNY